MTKMVCRHAMALCLLLALAAVTLFAQTNAALTGQVSDPQKAVLTQAKVTAINNNTNVQYTTQTNRSGAYVIPSLPPGEYRIEVEKAGFRKYEQKNLQLLVNLPMTVNATLEIGATSQIVEVSALAATLNTTCVQRSSIFNLRKSNCRWQGVRLFWRSSNWTRLRIGLARA